MTRQSNDEMKDGLVYNGFDYDLQVWVVNGIIQKCGHPSWSRKPPHVGPAPCCNAAKYAGRSLANVLAERGTYKARGR